MRENIRESLSRSIKNTINAQYVTVVHNGDPDRYNLSPAATFIRSLLDKITDVLKRNGRKFDNLYVAKTESDSLYKRWLVFTSSGSPELVFYYYYDHSTYKSFFYTGWTKHKTQDLLELSPAVQDSWIADTSQPDPVMMWRKDRSIASISAALAVMDKDQADKFIKLMKTKLVAAVGRLEISSVDSKTVLNFIKSLETVGTSSALELAKLTKQEYKKNCMGQLVDVMRRGYVRHLPQLIILLRNNGFDWPELAVLERNI